MLSLILFVISFASHPVTTHTVDIHPDRTISDQGTHVDVCAHFLNQTFCYRAPVFEHYA